jgi:hypothetical protein
MLTLFNAETPDSIATAVEAIVERALRYIRALNLPEKNWDGDAITIKTQFPQWIQDLYEQNPDSAPVVDFFIFYYRWLFDYEDGYGMGFYLEDLRDIALINSDFLQPYADDVFSQQLDLTEYSELVENFRTFMLSHDRDYRRIRGTPEGIEYFIKTMFDITTVNVITTSAANILIETDSTLSSSYQNLVKDLACPYSFNVTFTVV